MTWRSTGRFQRERRPTRNDQHLRRIAWCQTTSVLSNGTRSGPSSDPVWWIQNHLWGSCTLPADLHTWLSHPPSFGGSKWHMIHKILPHMSSTQIQPGSPVCRKRKTLLVTIITFIINHFLLQNALNFLYLFYSSSRVDGVVEWRDIEEPVGLVRTTEASSRCKPLLS